MTGPLAHEALLYADEAHLLEVAVPYLREGLHRGEQVVSVTGWNELLREALGADAARVEFADATEWFARPATTFSSYQTFIDQRLAPGAPPARVLAEAVWAIRTPEEVSEWQRLESVVNHAFADARMRVICCYDRRRSPDSLLEAALRSHPAICDVGGVRASADFTPPEHFVDELERTLPLPPPPPDALALPVAGDLGALRQAVREAAAYAGLPDERREDAVLVANELLTNHLKYSPGAATLHAWQTGDGLACELRDDARRRPPALAGYVRTPSPTSIGWGLPLVRQVADLVHVVDRGDHSAIRAVFRR